MPCCCAEKRVGLMDDLLAAAEIVLTWVSSPILGFNSSKWIDIEAQARQITLTVNPQPSADRSDGQNISNPDPASQLSTKNESVFLPSKVAVSTFQNLAGLLSLKTM
ncbi:hypothetical protein BY996DRAFT_6414199 [Phakopsora pachyrhizi]|nr:hypothetical protein BY996DRAFT_6414199 [Phakopsora pachyrhizi]